MIDKGFILSIFKQIYNNVLIFFLYYYVKLDKIDKKDKAKWLIYYWLNVSNSLFLTKLFTKYCLLWIILLTFYLSNNQSNTLRIFIPSSLANGVLSDVKIIFS